MTDEWQSSLRNVFTFMRKHQFLEPIVQQSPHKQASGYTYGVEVHNVLFLR